MSAIFFIGGTVIACGFAFIGWGSEGYFSKVCMFVGGLYFGHLITEALIGRTK